MPPPDDCGAWRGPRRPGDDGGDASAFGFTERPVVGHHLVSEHREAPLLDANGDRPGHMALWARLAGDLAATGPVNPAVLGFLADMIPLAVARACGVAGAGTSLDNPPPDPAPPPCVESA